MSNEQTQALVGLDIRADRHGGVVVREKTLPVRTRRKTAPREIIIVGSVAFVPLSRDTPAIISIEDVPLVAGRNWYETTERHPARTNYAAARGPSAKAPRIRMHRLITGAREGELVDHINGNGLDNRRENLRICTPTQNIMNKGAIRNGFKGVTPSRKKFEARIAGKHLGSFDTELEAAHAYDDAAREMFGEFAWLNFPSNEASSDPVAPSLDEGRR